MYETRVGPTGNSVAIRNRPSDLALPWSVSNGTFVSDESVADWTPLAPATPSASPDGLDSRFRPVALEFRLALNRQGGRAKDAGKVAWLEITDSASQVGVMEAGFTAEQFADLMAGRIPGSVDGVLTDVLRPDLMERIGKTLHTWIRILPIGVDEQAVAARAEELRAFEGLATVGVKRVRDGVRVTWRTWEKLSGAEAVAIERRLSTASFVSGE